MTNKDFTLTLTTKKKAHEVFLAIQNVSKWWCGYHEEVITGNTQSRGDEFVFQAAGGKHYSKQKLVEVIPDRKLVWLVTESKLTFLEEQDEWTGTKLIFDISEKDGETELTFTHEGLTPQVECFDICTPSWTQYLQNRLLPLINKTESVPAV